jgi:hypothetical protein
LRALFILHYHWFAAQPPIQMQSHLMLLSFMHRIILIFDRFFRRHQFSPCQHYYYVFTSRHVRLYVSPLQHGFLTIRVRMLELKTAATPRTSLKHLTYWVIQNDCGQVWQPCTKIYLDGVELTFVWHFISVHLIFFIPVHVDLTIFKIARLWTVKEMSTLSYPTVAT